MSGGLFAHQQRIYLSGWTDRRLHTRLHTHVAVEDRMPLSETHRNRCVRMPVKSARRGCKWPAKVWGWWRAVSGRLWQIIHRVVSTLCTTVRGDQDFAYRVCTAGRTQHRRGHLILHGCVVFVVSNLVRESRSVSGLRMRAVRQPRKSAALPPSSLESHTRKTAPLRDNWTATSAPISR